MPKTATPSRLQVTAAIRDWFANANSSSILWPKLTRKAFHAPHRAQRPPRTNGSSQGPRNPAQAGEGLDRVPAARPEPGCGPQALRAPGGVEPGQAGRGNAPADPGRVPSDGDDRLGGAGRDLWQV